MVEIVTETFDRAWWRTYATTLLRPLIKTAFTSEPCP
jgi:siderophore synthetase component